MLAGAPLGELGGTATLEAWRHSEIAFPSITNAVTFGYCYGYFALLAAEMIAAATCCG
jgi:hypothetical protein